MAGALTPTEVITAWRAGADFVRIFPCANVGGPSYIRELKAAMPQIPMVPTGGVSAITAAEFFEAGASALGIGCDLISNAALKSGNLLEITRAALHYASIARAAREAA